MIFLAIYNSLMFLFMFIIITFATDEYIKKLETVSKGKVYLVFIIACVNDLLSILIAFMPEHMVPALVENFLLILVIATAILNTIGLVLFTRQGVELTEKIDSKLESTTN